ncbi:excalibur calcium-binding domain-containing protein [Streptomyces sp. NPDC002328]|uniref:excalibur calcium-binding domain-containing protein n=1 Tax=Streptomyces sp. NPDC002328 TaxID=3364642 RepID=UPI0036C8543F
MTNPYTYTPTAPRWARKRYVLPALALSLLIGVGIGNSEDPKTTEAKPLSATPQPTVTVTTTATQQPAPAPTVTATETVKVQVTETVTAPAAAANEDTTSDTYTDPSDDSADVYYANCSAARAAGAAPLHTGDPGYAPHLDRDGDGSACE